MGRFRKWLANQFLPTWARESLYREIQKLEKENRVLQEKNRLLNAYVDGMEAAMKAQKRIIINNTEGVSK